MFHAYYPYIVYTSITYVLATNMLNREGVCWHTLKTHKNGQWKNKVLKMVYELSKIQKLDEDLPRKQTKIEFGWRENARK